MLVVVHGGGGMEEVTTLGGDNSKISDEESCHLKHLAKIRLIILDT